MATSGQSEPDDRMDRLEHKIDALTNIVALVARELGTVNTDVGVLKTDVTEARVENTRSFGDLRNAIRHFGVRFNETERGRHR